MARETKIGVALMALLIGVFGFVVYKKWDSLKPATIAAAGSEKAAPAKKGPAEPKPAGGATTEPPSNPFATVTSSDVPPTGQAEPADPFAGVVASDRVPIREVSATSTDDGAPPAGEPFSREEPISAVADAAPPAQGKPGGAFSEAPSEIATTSDASAEPAAPADDPFGDVAASPSAEGAGSVIPDETFAAAESSEPSAEAGAAETTVAADATDPFGGAAEATPEAAPTAGAESVDDPFAGASGTATADAGDSGFAEPQAAATAEADPFAGAESAPAAAAEPSPVADASDAFEPAAAAEPAASAEASLAGIEPEPGGLFEPATASPPEEAATASAGVDHVVVEENENYWSISKRVYGTPAYFHALAKYNEPRIRDPKRLRPGMTVLTPAAEELAARYPKLISSGGSAAPAEDAGRAGFLVDGEGRPAYRVGKDDTLGKIAQEHLGRASRWVQIYEMNRAAIPNAKALKPGTVLRLPGDASRVRLASKG